MINYKSLVQQKANIHSPIAEVTRFETWWNKNLATAITDSYFTIYGGGDPSYRVFLIVYDSTNDSVQTFPTDHYCQYWGQYHRKGHGSLTSAQNEAAWLREVLNGSNPILCVHPKCDIKVDFSEIVREPYVSSSQIGIFKWDNWATFLSFASSSLFINYSKWFR